MEPLRSTGARPSWMFNRSTYTHAPETGARVAQYERHVAVEELPDPRRVTSGYRRTRTTLRGADGSVDASYQVQNWANGNGGLDAEWERFHDAWQQSYLRGSYYNNNYNSRYPGRRPLPQRLRSRLWKTPAMGNNPTGSRMAPRARSHTPAIDSGPVLLSRARFC